MTEYQLNTKHELLESETGHYCDLDLNQAEDAHIMEQANNSTPNELDQTFEDIS